MYIFKSERLGFRNWREEDLEPFSKINGDSAVMEFFPNTQTRQESNTLILRLGKHYEQHGYTFYAVDQLQDNTFIGFIGFVNTPFDASFTPCVEIGWRLAQSAWGKGYATEGARKCLKYGFHELGFRKVYSFTSVINKRSERVMQKIGMMKEGTFLHPQLDRKSHLANHVLYKIIHSGEN